ncbi:hypothetical protein ABTY61_39030 [Kitasatospora sp. NPDC096128]|uniref:hypothetical protein n=1 Tax=Kitasatospora sp. NPDC096128 TaxID=3155547 RepID=UPI00332449FF
MSPAPAHHTGLILAQVAGLLPVFGGIWPVAAQVPRLRHSTARMVVAGVAFAAAGVLLIIAVHRGYAG